MRHIAFVVLCLASALNAQKAGLLRGLAPASQLQGGNAKPSSCLNGNSTQNPCRAGSPAGITYATTAQNWAQTLTTVLTGGKGAQSITLTPCPVGVDTSSGLGYDVYLADGSSSETVPVTGGTCAPGASSGTITFSPHFSHPIAVSYTAGSASSGIQETINAACGTSTKHYQNAQCNVVIPANGYGYPTFAFNTYNVQGTIYWHVNQGTLSGYGTSLSCSGRGPCIQIGDLVSSPHYVTNTISGLIFQATAWANSPPVPYLGVNITSTMVSRGVGTITTSAAHGFRPGDMVTILYTDNSRYWGDALVTSIPTSTSFTFAHPKNGGTIASQTTPVVAFLAYEAFLDNGLSTHFADIGYNSIGATGKFNNFFDMWDDENASITNFNNGGIPLLASATNSSSWVFSGGAQNLGASHQLAPVISLRDSNMTGQGTNCVTDFNSNGLYIENVVCQDSGLWEVYSANITGNFSGAQIVNLYSEDSLASNPSGSPLTPYPGTGIAGLIAGPTAQNTGQNFQISGVGGVFGAFATGGAGSTPYTYYIVAHDTTGGTVTSPMQVLNWKSTGSDSIPVKWPRVASGADTITYDVIRMTTPALPESGSTGNPFPYYGGCPGGTGGTCGSVITGLSQVSACSGGLVCTYTDTGSSSTSAYTVLVGTGSVTFWPGAIVAVNHTVNVNQEQSPIVGVGLAGNPAQQANLCTGYGVTSPGGYTVCNGSQTTPNDSIEDQTATIFTEGGSVSGGLPLNAKGRLNISNLYGLRSPQDFITLYDSQPQLTRATLGFRPLASPNDVAIGTDCASTCLPNAVPLALRSPVSISNYVGALPSSGLGWLERLTSKQKTFAVPVRISEGNSFTLGDGSPLSQMKVYSVDGMPASQVPPQSCIDMAGKVKSLTKSDQISSITPPGPLGNLSLNAYTGDAGTIVLHFCNPSKAEVITPPGSYSFLAVR